MLCAKLINALLSNMVAIFKPPVIFSLFDANVAEWSKIVQKVKQAYGQDVECLISGHGPIRGV